VSERVGRSPVVVITGASSGIGRAAAELFARRGWRVGLIARGEVGLADTRRKIVEAGGSAHAEIADVALSETLERAAAAIEQVLGPIDAWVNCAGNGVYGTFLTVSEAEFERVTQVTYLGVVNGTRAALMRMVPRDRGVVVNVCSAIAYHGMPLLASYSGAKYAVRGFTEAVRAELRHERRRVHLTIIYPPAVNTPFFSHAQSHLKHPPRPAPPVYQPEIVAEGIYLAATTRRRELRIGGITIAFAWLTMLAPWLAAYFIDRLGYDGQVIDDDAVRDRRDPTLAAPSSRPSGTHGPFDKGALRHCPQLWLSRHRRMVAVVLGVALLALVMRWR
jgi:short-subunit dehydrogenase